MNTTLGSVTRHSPSRTEPKYLHHTSHQRQIWALKKFKNSKKRSKIFLKCWKTPWSIYRAFYRVVTHFLIFIVMFLPKLECCPWYFHYISCRGVSVRYDYIFLPIYSSLGPFGWPPKPPQPIYFLCHTRPWTSELSDSFPSPFVVGGRYERLV